MWLIFFTSLFEDCNCVWLQLPCHHKHHDRGGIFTTAPHHDVLEIGSDELILTEDRFVGLPFPASKLCRQKPQAAISPPAAWALKTWQMQLYSISVCFSDNPRQSSQVPVYIRLLDVNDNAPTFATTYETYVCERTKPAQVFIGFLSENTQRFKHYKPTHQLFILYQACLCGSRITA